MIGFVNCFFRRLPSRSRIFATTGQSPAPPTDQRWSTCIHSCFQLSVSSSRIASLSVFTLPSPSVAYSPLFSFFHCSISSTFLPPPFSAVPFIPSFSFLYFFSLSSFLSFWASATFLLFLFSCSLLPSLLPPFSHVQFFFPSLYFCTLFVFLLPVSLLFFSPVPLYSLSSTLLPQSPCRPFSPVPLFRVPLPASCLCELMPGAELTKRASSKC